MKTAEEYVASLNARTADERLEALRALMRLHDDEKLARTPSEGYVNNHIHTIYSFSPYSPTAAVYAAWSAGLDTAGIMDHDSVSGAREFIEAGAIARMPVTVGAECRVRTDGTPLFGRRINNPDQISVVYVALHGIPHTSLDAADAFFRPCREKRNERNKKMCARINDLVPAEAAIDFERDVLPLSRYDEGGSVTERHILFALTKKLTAAYPDPPALADYLCGPLSLSLPDKLKARLLEADPRYYEYDILGVLKSALVEKIYVDADEECPHITEYIDACRRFGAISAYAYLGDVGESVTGDKKAQRFEDSYLDELFAVLKSLGFDAVTYMPTRNTRAQLDRVMRLCRETGFFEISGEDINSPRQSFVCRALDDPAFSHLKEATYALIGHERAATRDLSDGMFSDKTKAALPDLSDRVKKYAAIGRAE